MHNKLYQNANFSGPKQNTAATTTEAKVAQFEKIKNRNPVSKVNLAKTNIEATRSRPTVRFSCAIVQPKDRVGHVCERDDCDVCADMPALAPDWQGRIMTSRVPLVSRLMSLQAKRRWRAKCTSAQRDCKSCCSSVRATAGCSKTERIFISLMFLATVDDPEVVENVKRIKLQCETDREKGAIERLASSEANT